MYEFKNPKIGISILNADYLNLGYEIKRVKESGADFLHLDIMDGNFVPEMSFGQLAVQNINKISDLPLHIHLMIKNTEQQLDSFIRLKPDHITVHAETCSHLDKVLSDINKEGISSGVALNPSTPLSFLENVLDKLDSILILTVNPGFGGQKFIESMPNKINKCKNMIDDYLKYAKKRKAFDITVDGGINIDTINKARQAGADSFVIGTAFFKSSNPKNFITDLRNEIIKELRI